jgi:hypothetical protein
MKYKSAGKRTSNANLQAVITSCTLTSNEVVGPITAGTITMNSFRNVLGCQARICKGTEKKRLMTGSLFLGVNIPLVQ